jgi:hypothetical protein
LHFRLGRLASLLAEEKRDHCGLRRTLLSGYRLVYVSRVKRIIECRISSCITLSSARKLPRSDHEASLLLIEDSLGWVSTSEEFVKALQVTAKASV